MRNPSLPRVCPVTRLVSDYALDAVLQWAKERLFKRPLASRSPETDEVPGTGNKTPDVP